MTQIVAEDLTREFTRGKEVIRAVDQVSLSLDRGGSVALTGPSGSGKSTLLHLIGGLDRPTSGRVLIDSQDLASLSDGELTDLRRRQIGFVFQFFNLVPTMAAWENVALPAVLEGKRLGKQRARARELLASVGLVDRADHRPSELSGGELQRVAIARALFFDPLVLLADEPTGSLDSDTGKAVLDVLLRSTDDRSVTTMVVTHDPVVADSIGTQIRMLDGKVT